MMFSPVPSLEELSLRLEVQWQGRARPVVARLEQWLGTSKAALVCVFEDEESAGAWLVVDKGSHLPYTLGRPDKLTGKEFSFDEVTRVLSKTQRLKERGVEKLRDILRRAFAEEDFTVARVFELPELPAQRNLAICNSKICQWVFGFNHQNWAAFPSQSLFEASHTQAQAQLRAQWQIVESEVRFAWEWAAIDDAQRKHQLGWPASWQAMERVMHLVLASKKDFWRNPDEIYWMFHINEETDGWTTELWSLSQNAAINETRLRNWSEFLIAHFIPHWRIDLVRRYFCVSQFVKANCYNGAGIDAFHLPTAHEQLEAKLALRDWLKGKATPAQTARLLAELDD